MTNADKIRNMTDEELYELILGLNGHCLAGIGECNCSDEATVPCDEVCKKKTREWLQSEVKDDLEEECASMIGIDKTKKNLIKFDIFNEKNIFDKMQSPHTYVCKICGIQFGGSAYSYMKHMKTIHDINISKISLKGEEFPRI